MAILSHFPSLGELSLLVFLKIILMQCMKLDNKVQAWQMRGKQWILSIWTSVRLLTLTPTNPQIQTVNVWAD